MFDKEPPIYNKQFLFYIAGDKILVCNSSFIRDTIINLPLQSKINPWIQELVIFLIYYFIDIIL